MSFFSDPLPELISFQVEVPAAKDGFVLLRMESEVLKLKAKAKNLPYYLGLEQIATLSDENADAFLMFITSESVKIVWDRNMEMVISKDDYRDYLKISGQWPLPKDCLLSGWWLDDEYKPLPNIGIYERREADCDSWREDTGVDITALSDSDTLKQLQVRHAGLWKSLKDTSFRSEFYTKYSKKRGIKKKTGPKSK